MAVTAEGLGGRRPRRSQVAPLEEPKELIVELKPRFKEVQGLAESVASDTTTAEEENRTESVQLSILRPVVCG